MTETRVESREGTESATDDPPPSHAENPDGKERANRPERERRRQQRRRQWKKNKIRKMREAGTERPHWGGPVKVNCVGGDANPQRKTRNSWDSTQNMRICCCRDSMETSRITTTGRTWTGE